MPSAVITGSNRGIGLEFVKIYAKRGWKVYGACRNPQSVDAKVDGDIEWVKYDGESFTDAGELAKTIEKNGGSVDVVIANAAINDDKSSGAMAEVDPKDVNKHLHVNVTAPLILFQAFKPLLEATSGKFITISSGAGTIKQDLSFPVGGVYGLTKASLNYLTRKLAHENKQLFVAALHPGWVVTDMGSRGAKLRGLENGPPDDISKTVPGMVKLIDEADKENVGGWTTAWDGQRLEY